MVTATINILNRERKPIQCRTLLDTCSTANFMTETLADALHLKKSKSHIPVGALNAMTTYSKGILTATIKSRINNFEKDLTFLIIPHISSVVPDQPIQRNLIKIPSNIKLADPEFHKPAPVDLLIGAGTTLSLLSIGQIHLSSPNHQDVYLQKTLLGWIIGGAAPNYNRFTQSKCHQSTAMNFELSKFWEIEECSEEQDLTTDEKLCEQHFKVHVSRTPQGRYIVALPFKSEQTKLGNSYHHALKRFENTERRLNQDPKLKEQYQEVLNEYLTLGHMSLTNEDPLTSENYYLPHHAVFKETSMTTKVRVVFDGSAKSSTGVSLNDSLFTGPTIQSDLFALLIRFRKYPIVLTGDIEKMYRQFLIRKEDRRFQRILWRDKENKLKTYELNTVTFGITPAPYLAIRCLHQLADDEGHNYPRAKRVLKEDFYVDDVLTGANDLNEAVTIRNELSQILSSAGLSIRQWASNDIKVLDGLPFDSINRHLQLGDTTTLKTLGIHWNSTTDAITYSVRSLESSPKITKRSILSLTAKIFDPLGLLAPVIILAKIILQRLWTLKVHWDESLPSDVHSEWQNYSNQLKQLDNLAFPRTIISPHTKKVQLHGFSDASERAYGACVYLRVIDASNQVKVQLLCAKSRVSPLKSLTIPKLELCGAQLLATLVNSTIAVIKLHIDQVTYWTDSTIVLHWLNTPSHQLKTFVSNRVAMIQNKTNVKDWRHVRTKDNPADLISRGKMPNDFITTSIWRTGPSWLAQSSEYWPKFELQGIKEVPEKRHATCLTTTVPSTLIFDRFSTITKLLRVLSYCFRFIQRKKIKTFLTANELQMTLKRVLRAIQQHEFPEEIKTLRKNQSLQTKSLQLIKLNPYIDKYGLMRVGGRLSLSELPFNSRHPIILPKDNHVTKLLIYQVHQNHLHAGVHQTLYALRQNYWPIDGRSQVWKIINKCVDCRKVKPRPTNYLMGQLPTARVNQSRPFTHVGVDFCGPFILKEKKLRNRTSIKAYVAVFICLAVKAVHLELVTDLSTEGFLFTLRRFIARRGHCQDIYSDNGTNFVGANNTLKELSDLFKSADHQEKVHGYLTTKNIQWHFNPPKAPHTGGLWEAAVKSFKRHLQHVAGRDMLFTYEQFNTFVAEIEAILNSRPLSPVSSDPNDPLVLTPGHFLIGDSLTNLRGRDYTDIPENRLSTWQHLQQLKRHFWNRWRKEYLNELTIRNKWLKSEPSIALGAIVLLKEDHLPPAQWALGRIIKCYPGEDGIVRTVQVKTSTSSFTRNIKKLVILPIEPTDQSSSKADLP